MSEKVKTLVIDFNEKRNRKIFERITELVQKSKLTEVLKFYEFGDLFIDQVLKSIDMQFIDYIYFVEKLDLKGPSTQLTMDLVEKHAYFFDMTASFFVEPVDHPIQLKLLEFDTQGRDDETTKNHIDLCKFTVMLMNQHKVSDIVFYKCNGDVVNQVLNVMALVNEYLTMCAEKDGGISMVSVLTNQFLIRQMLDMIKRGKLSSEDKKESNERGSSNNGNDN